ncbi:MAG: hypothetical protein V3U53_05490 [bacterium]
MLGDEDSGVAEVFRTQPGFGLACVKSLAASLDEGRSPRKIHAVFLSMIDKFIP